MTPDEAQARLSPRQRECLKRVWLNQATSKEIALALGISKATVDGYIAESVQALAARDRRDAAAIAFGERPPAASGGDPARVGAGLPDEAAPRTGSEPRRPATGWQRWLPFRTGATNDLHPAARLVWILLLTIGFAGSLSLVINSLVLFSDLFR